MALAIADLYVGSFAFVFSVGCPCAELARGSIHSVFAVLCDVCASVAKSVLLFEFPHRSLITRGWPPFTSHVTLATMNRSAFITTLIPAIAIAYLLVKFSDLPWTALLILALILTIAGIIARYRLGKRVSPT
jgi:hypothetical protein